MQKVRKPLLVVARLTQKEMVLLLQEIIHTQKEVVHRPLVLKPTQKAHRLLLPIPPHTRKVMVLRLKALILMQKAV